MSLNKALMDWNGHDTPQADDLEDDSMIWGYQRALEDVTKLLRGWKVENLTIQEINRLDDFEVDFGN